MPRHPCWPGGSALQRRGARPHDLFQVVDRIAELYLQRRDILLGSGDRRGITISALTNADTADLSRAIRDRMKARGELRNDEQVYDAIDQRGDDVAARAAGTLH